MWAHFLDPHKQYLDHPGFTELAKNRATSTTARWRSPIITIGRVLRADRRVTRRRATVIIITGDHGEAFGEHGFFFHGREVWDEIVHVPLVMYVPAPSPAGSRAP